MRTGLFRLWLVGSLLWIGYCAWRSDLTCWWRFETEPWCRDPVTDLFSYYRSIALRMIGAPLLAGLGIIAALWVGAGFRRRP
jgi:hypothetical protein